MGGRSNFSAALQEQFDLTPAQADHVIDVFDQERVLDVDKNTGQFRVVHGAFWDKRVIQRALQTPIKPRVNRAKRVSAKQREAALEARAREIDNREFANTRAVLQRQSRPAPLLASPENVPTAGADMQINDRADIETRLERIDAEIVARETNPVYRPAWAAGLTDAELVAIAEHEGENPYDRDWADGLDEKVIAEAKQGRFKNPNVPTLTELRTERRRLEKELENTRPTSRVEILDFGTGKAVTRRVLTPDEVAGALRKQSERGRALDLRLQNDQTAPVTADTETELKAQRAFLKHPRNADLQGVDTKNARAFAGRARKGFGGRRQRFSK